MICGEVAGSRNDHRVRSVKEQVADLHARLLAAFIDSNVLATGVLSCFFLYDYVFAPNKVWLYVLTGGVLLAYEPLAVAWRGQTLGHWFKNIRIVDATSGRRIGFTRALVRYLIKYALWPLSLSWMVFSHWHHSIQDLFTRSRSVSADKLATDTAEFGLHSRVPGTAQVLVTLVWLVGLLWLFNSALTWLLPQCARSIVVTGYCGVVAWIDDLGDVFIWILVFWHGSAGRLPGGRLT